MRQRQGGADMLTTTLRRIYSPNIEPEIFDKLRASLGATYYADKPFSTLLLLDNFGFDSTLLLLTRERRFRKPLKKFAAFVAGRAAHLADNTVHASDEHYRLWRRIAPDSPTDMFETAGHFALSNKWTHDHALLRAKMFACSAASHAKDFYTSSSVLIVADDAALALAFAAQANTNRAEWHSIMIDTLENERGAQERELRGILDRETTPHWFISSMAYLAIRELTKLLTELRDYLALHAGEHGL